MRTEYPYVAHVTIDKLFGCTGPLVAPTWVVTAGHCSSLTGVAVVTPIGQPGQLIDIRLGLLRDVRRIAAGLGHADGPDLRPRRA